jgi:hypothetical protein
MIVVHTEGKGIFTEGNEGTGSASGISRQNFLPSNMPLPCRAGLKRAGGLTTGSFTEANEANEGFDPQANI